MATSVFYIERSFALKVIRQLFIITALVFVMG